MSKLDIVAGLDKAVGPYSATTSRNAGLVPLVFSGGVTAIELARPVSCFANSSAADTQSTDV